MDGWMEKMEGRTCLSSVLPVVNGRSVVTVTGRDGQLCLCTRPSVYSLCVLTPPMCVFSPLRRGGGGGVPGGREGHGTAGGSGVRRGPDHPLRHHLLLTHPRHPVKEGKKKTLDELKDRRWERRRLSSSSRPGLWRAEEAGIALDLWGWMQERAPPGVSALLLPQSHCSPEGTQCRPACLCVGERHQAETAPSSASGRESHVCGCFQSNITVSCQQPFSGTSRCLCGHWLWRLSVALVGGKKKPSFLLMMIWWSATEQKVEQWGAFEGVKTQNSVHQQKKIRCSSVLNISLTSRLSSSFLFLKCSRAASWTHERDATLSFALCKRRRRSLWAGEVWNQWRRKPASASFGSSCWDIDSSSANKNSEWS